MSYIGNTPGLGQGLTYIYNLTAGQASVSGADALGRTLAYTPGLPLIVAYNGAVLNSIDEFTATTGSSITFTGWTANAGDTLVVIAFAAFTVADAPRLSNNLADLPDPAAARTALSLASAALRAIATAAEFRAVTANRAIGLAEAFAAAAPVSFTDAATVTVDLNTGVNFDLLATSGVGATRQLANPTNVVPGKTGLIRFQQDATGTRALTFAANYDHPNGSAPSTSTAANAKDYFSYFCWSSTEVLILPLGRAFA